MMKTRKRQKIIPLLALTVIVLTGAILALTLGSGQEAEEPLPPDPHQGEVQVNDGTGEVWIPLEENVNLSLVGKTDFSANENGWPVYTGDRYLTYRGIDVSELQGAINWQKVKAAGIDFAFLRIGFRGYGESGKLVEDGSFFRNLTDAKANGVRVGAYFFSQAVSAEEAEEEAEFVLKTLGESELDLPVIFDWERVEQEDSRTREIPTALLDSLGGAFCRCIEESGHQAGIYFSRQLGYYGYDLSTLKDYTWWVADPGTYPAFYYEAAFWQYSVDAEVPGIDIIVDMDMWFVPKERKGTPR